MFKKEPINKDPKFLDHRKFADLIKNAPLVSIDLIIRDQKDSILLQFREDRPAKGCWFVPGGRIRKFESIHNTILRIYENEIEGTFPNIDIDPNCCRLIGIYEHFYENDNKYTDSKEESLLDMKNEDTYYISIAYECKIKCYHNKPVKNFKWFTIHELLYGCSSVHEYTKDFFRSSFVAPRDSELYSALMSHYIHYDSQFWSRTQIVLAIQGAAFIGAYTMSPSLIPSIIMFCAAFLIFMVWLLVCRDIKNSRVNENAMDRISANLYSNYGPINDHRRPLSLRGEPISTWLTGRNIIHIIIFVLISFDIVLGYILYNNPNFLKVGGA